MSGKKSISDQISISRRTTLGVMGAAIGMAAAPLGGARADIPTSDFMAASAKLTGIDLDRSYIQTAQDVWRLSTLHGDSEMRELTSLIVKTPEADLPSALKRAGLTDAAKALLNLWYRGIVLISEDDLKNPVVLELTGDASGNPDPDKPGWYQAVYTYDEALTWRACTFTKPSATCGGPFGYWKNPPV